MKFFVLGFLLLLSLPARADVTIAAVGPLTGQDATTGEQMKRGAQAAVDAINAAGGVLEQRINLVFKDDACDPKQAVAIANALSSKDVVAVIGPMCSGTAIPAAKILNEEGIMMISPSATNPALTDDGLDTVFRTCGRDDQQGGIIADYINQNFAWKSIAIVQDKTAYGQGLADVVRDKLVAQGQTIKLYESISRGERDYGSLISKLKENKIDVVFFGGYHTEAGLIVRQMRDQNLTAVFVGDDDLATHEYWDITGDAGEGSLMSFNTDPRTKAEAGKAVKQLKGQGFDPEGTTLYTYAAVQVVAQALNIVGAVDSIGVANIIHGHTFSTVIGDLSFDKKGDVTKPDYIMYRWSNGAYTPVAN